MASSALQFDLTTAYLDQPSFIAYGLVRGAGNLVLQQQLSDNSTLAFYVLGDGPWDSLLRLWINRKQIALPSSQAHFHPGLDGEIGSGMAAASTGGDQHVDAFWSSVPGLSTLTYSRYAWLGLKVPPDPGAPSASLEVLADYQAMKCRLFDASGNQTAFQWTQNPAWWICDRIIRKFILREAKVNQPLVAAERARFDWQSFSDAAAYCDADIGGGIKRFSDGGVVYLDGSLTEDRVLEQLLLMSRSYILERNGKICLYADQPRASVFTFTSDNIVPQSFVAKKSNLRSGKNRISASFREIGMASGSADDATRFAVSTQKLDHEAHQRAIGVRGPGLSIIPKAKELQLDFGNNSAERVARLLQYQLVRQLGDDADPNLAYNAPFAPEWTGYEDSLKVEVGDPVTIHASISEEFAGKIVEVLEVEERPDGTRAFKGLECEDNAFTDVAPTQQLIEAPTPGTGLTLPNGVEMVRNPTLEYGDSGWTKEAGFSIVSDPANAYAGSWVAQFVGSAAAAFRNAVVIAVQPGDRVMASCMAKRTAGDGAGRVRIDWLSSALAELSSSGGNAVTSSTYSSSRVVGAAPASAAFARVEASVTGITVSTTAYFDQFNASLFPLHLGEVLDDAGSSRYAVLAVDAARRALVDFSQAGHTNKHLGNIADDAGSARYAVLAVDANRRAVVDFAQTHVNKNLDNVSDGATYFRTVANEKTGAARAFSALDANSRLASTSKLTTVNSGNLFPGGVLSCPNNGTISIAAAAAHFGFGTVTYNSGSLSGQSATLYNWVYADDPTYAGGAVTYLSSTTSTVIVDAEGRVYFGRMIAVTSASPTGGGSRGTI